MCECLGDAAGLYATVAAVLKKKNKHKKHTLFVALSLGILLQFNNIFM